MSGAIWTTARNKKFAWWSTWRERRTGKKSARGNVTPGTAKPLVLIGSFESGEGLARAANGFAGSRFTADEAIFIRGCLRGKQSWWRSCRDWAYAWFLLPASRDEPEEGMQLPLDPAFVDRVLARGGGFVLVRSAARFQQACEIIEGAGGRIGPLGGTMTAS